MFNNERRPKIRPSIPLEPIKDLCDDGFEPACESVDLVKDTLKKLFPDGFDTLKNQNNKNQEDLVW